MAKPKEQSWIVRMHCTVNKEIVTDNCTKKQAEEEPFLHSLEERELDCPDWEVLSVTPNE